MRVDVMVLMMLHGVGLCDDVPFCPRCCCQLGAVSLHVVPVFAAAADAAADVMVMSGDLFAMVLGPLGPYVSPWGSWLPWGL